MTPERLAFIEDYYTHQSGVAFSRHRGNVLDLIAHIRDLEAPPKCARGCDRDGVGSPCIHELSPDELTGVASHVRDLETQLAAARDIINEIRSEAQRTINWNQTRGMRPATDTSMFAGSYGTALRVSRLIDAVLATATPPSPEVE